MSQSYVNQVTIDCLLNKNVINKYVKNKENTLANVCRGKSLKQFKK